MGWTTTSVVTTQVMDENPMTWLNAGVKAFHEHDYSKGLEYMEQAIKLGKNNSDVLIRGYAYKVLLLYGLGKKSEAGAFFKKAQNEVNMDAYLNSNPEILIAYLDFDYDAWDEYWLQTIKQKIAEKNLTFFTKCQSHIEPKTLADNANAEFVSHVIKKKKNDLLSVMIDGGLPIISLQSGNNNMLQVAVESGNKEAVQIILKANMQGTSECWKNVIKEQAKNNDVSFFIAYEERIPAQIMAEFASSDLVIAILSEPALKQLVKLVDGGMKLESLKSVDNGSILHLVSLYGDLNSCKYVLENLSNVSSYINQYDSCQMTPLLLAIMMKKSSVARLLVDKGADVNVMDINKRTPLLMAVKYGFPDLIEKLIQHGCNIHAENDKGDDALKIAILHNGSKIIAELLLKNGANPNNHYATLNNRTILMEIAARNHWKGFYPSLWKLLLEHNAKVDERDNDGKTALMLSLDHSWYFSDELDLPKALVAKGASMYMSANNGESASAIIKRRNISW